MCVCVLGGVGEGGMGSSSKLSLIPTHDVEARGSMSSRPTLATRDPVSKKIQLLYCIIQLKSGKTGVKAAFKSLQENSTSFFPAIFFILEFHTCIKGI